MEQAQTRSGRHIYKNVQVLRFIAALLVLVAHSVDLVLVKHPDVKIPTDLGNFGAVGVDIFFVISGFIITTVAASSTRTPAQFAFDRIKRVVPLYWLASIPRFVVVLVGGTLSMQSLFVTLTFWPALGSQTVSPLLSIGWTLCFEMLFYLAAWVFLIAGKKPAAAWILVVIYFAAWVLLQLTKASAFQFIGNPIILEFLFGVGIALAAPLLPRRTAWPLIVVSILWFAVTIAFGYGDISETDMIANATFSLNRVTLWGIPSALLVAGAVLGRDWLGGKASKVSLLLGDASYSTYLFHLLALGALSRVSVLLPMPPIVLLLAAIAAGQITGVVAHLFVEKRLQRYLARRQPEERHPKGSVAN
jgi:exopolysaccharide production protein ExoZ